MHRHLGHAHRRVAPEQALGLELAQQLGPLGGHPPQEGGDVDLGEDEADLALGSIQVERAPQHDDHALGQLDALLGQRVPQRRPRAAPALDVEGGHATPGRRPGRRTLVAGVHQVHVEMARPVVREVLDLAAHPELAAPGEGRVQRALDLLVEAADGEDPAAPARARRRGRDPGWRAVPRQAGAEPRDRRADGHRPASSTPYRGAARPPATRGGTLVVTVSRPGGRGTGRTAGPCRGRSGLRRAGCWLTASRGDPQDSATERKPPMAGLQARTGKGERVR